MPKFEITAPDGRRFEITAPEGATPEQAVEWAKTNLGAAPPPKAPRDTGRRKTGMLDAITQGMTFGLSDEAAGLAAAIGPGLRSIAKDVGLPVQYEPGEFGAAWDRGVTQARNRLADYKDENPIVGTTAEIAGGFLGAAPGMVSKTAAQMSSPALLKSAFQRGPVFPDLAARGIGTAAPTTTLGAVGQGAKAGAVGGGLSGFGSGEGGLEERLEGAAIGGGLGSTIGAATPLIANAVSRVAGRVTDAVGLRNPQRGGNLQTLRAMERDKAGGGPGIHEVYGRIMSNQGADARPEFLADMGGENLKRLASMTTQTPGAARQAAREAIAERTAGQADRISDDIMRLLSPNADWHGTVDSLNKARSSAARPFYERAFNSGPVADKTIMDVASDPIIRQGAQFGIRTQVLEDIAQSLKTGNPRTFDPNKFGVVGFDEAFNPILGEPSKWTTRTLDAAKRGIDEMLEKYRNEITGKLVLDERGRAMEGVRSGLVARLKALTGGEEGDYAQGLKAWAGPSRSKDMLALGRQVFSPDAEITEKTITKLLPSEKEMFLAGVAKAIRDRVENTADGRNAVHSFFSKAANRNKLKAAFPDAASYRQFEKLMRRETGMFEGQGVYGPRAGSPTQRNAADAQDAMLDPADGVLSNLMTGNFSGAARAGMSDIMRRAQGMNSSTADYLGPKLLTDSPSENEAFIRELLKLRQSNQAKLSQNQGLARALLGGTGTAVGVSTD